jgi:hypothetical protein
MDGLLFATTVLMVLGAVGFLFAWTVCLVKPFPLQELREKESQ